jgi:reverse gyrase
MKNIEQIMLLEELLDVAVDAGNLSHVREIMDSLHEYYDSAVEDIDLTRGLETGHLLINQESGLSFFDELRNNYQRMRELYCENSTFYKDTISQTLNNKDGGPC